MSKKLKLHPENFEQECTTVWSFPRRGNWATHNSKYRGNWSPDVVRNLILRYSKEGDYLLDPMIGGGTTAIECKLLNRNLLAYDINPKAIELTEKALDFEVDSRFLLSQEGQKKERDSSLRSEGQKESFELIDFSANSKGQKEQKGRKQGIDSEINSEGQNNVMDSEINSEGRDQDYELSLQGQYVGNENFHSQKGQTNKIKLELRNATVKNEKLKDESIDFVLMHPPYADIIKYSEGQIKEDLSNIHDLDKFCDEIEKISQESYRVLKKGKFCAILMGDTRRNKLYQPLTFKVMERFIKSGFALKEDIVKVQHNCKATGFWVKKSKEANFLLIMHEHLFIFQKL